MNQLHYRQEDRFIEASNAMKLRQLHADRDYTGLLELALILNYQASFNNSKVRWIMKEALEAARPGNNTYEIPEDFRHELEQAGWKAED